MSKDVFLLILIPPMGLLVLVSLLGVRGMRDLYRPWRTPSGREVPPVVRPATSRDRLTIGIALAVAAVAGGAVLYAFARAVIGMGSGSSALVGVIAVVAIVAVFGGLNSYLTGGRGRPDT